MRTVNVIEGIFFAALEKKSSPERNAYLDQACTGDPELRRCGAGALLLGAALDWGNSFRAEAAILEVRESNLAALRFYDRHGFHVMGRRPRYYTAPIENALLLIAPLAGAAPDA